MIERVAHQGLEYAVVIRASYAPTDRIEFCTPPEYSQQLAYMSRPKGRVIRAHIHNEVRRSVMRTCETLFIRKGKVRADFYDEQGAYFQSVDLGAGDVILFVQGGHGFTMLEDAEIVEVKQGPYAGDNDKSFLETHAPEERDSHDA